MRILRRKPCPKCNIHITLSNYERHVNTCTGEGTWEQREQKRKELHSLLKFKCNICQKLFKTSQALTGHLFRSHSDEGQKAAKLLKEGKVTRGHTGKKLSQSHKNKLSQLMSERIRTNIRYSKQTKYNGVWLDSSFELKVAQELDANGIEWVRPKAIKYQDKTGQLRRYLPDFYLPAFDIYLDPKNDFLIEQDAEKISLV